MIPKKIHYCWFGESAIPEGLQKYIDGWKYLCPDYEIIRWDETNFDVNCFEFTKAAYKAKKYAFVSDFVRVFSLNTVGGIYLDTDVELKRNIDELLSCEAFLGLESYGVVSSAVWGSIPKHSLTESILKYYTERTYNNKQEPNTKTITRVLVSDFLVDPGKNSFQKCFSDFDSINIFPIESFTLELDKNYATHHFYGSWVGGRKKNIKKSVEYQYHIGELIYEKGQCEDDFYRALSHQLSIMNIFFILIKSVYHKYVPAKIDAFISARRKL